ncbi:hypothetical protein, unlikely [Trypanosoma brucei gambiense DAL972]|uniref:Uncharacterized protein n=1 Tax=Trypanosoma brucei gambiense (strain MHOM/CI/86/DAL972) TaxID=679716 RepID=C9ZNA8_TRYB9|nr:hypothetical protein, unlikely [Trypanosoma brucei gambiense DAL972]CBH10886.1 hypothetical protein, unlikely [Trypanosoma brucei gambiense DAL972]|eukprot:XP_011773173.1 hypothetical protein, unlikely [Trypanosoma brucei gambiense DAL972]
MFMLLLQMAKSTWLSKLNTSLPHLTSAPYSLCYTPSQAAAETATDVRSKQTAPPTTKIYTSQHSMFSSPNPYVTRKKREATIMWIPSAKHVEFPSTNKFVDTSFFFPKRRARKGGDSTHNEEWVANTFTLVFAAAAAS